MATLTVFTPLYNRINTLKFTGSTSLQINNKGYVTLMYQISDGKWHVIDYRIGQP